MRKNIIKLIAALVSLWAVFGIVYNVIPIVRGQWAAAHFFKSLTNEDYRAASDYVMNADQQEWTRNLAMLKAEGLILTNYSDLMVTLDDSIVTGQTTISLMEGNVKKDYHVYIEFGGSRLSPRIANIQYTEADDTLKKWIQATTTASLP
ncbi:hypothetical protein QJ48_18870 [Paenibacillus sp. A3]|uniref:hypothetical protein n=1 Tax=Paenibacillus sp. A3 TaxID=1337054 RepID=UPI0006D5719C|nr:hypothetical protein [Paenibacillus sp. A3]KPV58039.1 hypothetical protein QJ48_18870 [Paenibacillus sp. A3]